MAFYSPLRYPGGKAKLSYYIKVLIERNDLLDGDYVEPFAGGAGVALELLFQEYTHNDLDTAIYSFWYYIVNEPENMCRLIKDTPVTVEEWEKQKNVLSLENNIPSLELAFATFFLNRTNRSGILKAGLIGGKQQSGKWKIDVRFNKKDLINRIEKISK